MSRARNEEGKFTKSTELADRTLGVRPFQEGFDEFLEIAAQRNMSPTELARIALKEWLDQQRELKEKQSLNVQLSSDTSPRNK